MDVAIDPVAFSLGPLPVAWYGIIIGAGAVIGLLIAIQEGKRFRIPAEFFMDLLLIGAPSAILMARIYYVAFEWERYAGDFWSVFKVWEGGIAIHGALIGAIISGAIYIKVKGYNFWRIADIAAPSLIIGQAIGRWGNFVNQEAHGGPVSETFLRETLFLPNFIVEHMYINGVFHHPTFLYESIWNVLVLVVLLFLRRKIAIKAGELFLSYFILYSVGRFFIEGLRTDSLVFSGPEWLAAMFDGMWYPMSLLFGDAGAMPADANMRIAQVIGVVIILAAIALIVLRRQLGYAREYYKDPIQRHGRMQ